MYILKCVIYTDMTSSSIGECDNIPERPVKIPRFIIKPSTSFSYEDCPTSQKKRISTMNTPVQSPKKRILHRFLSPTTEDHILSSTELTEMTSVEFHSYMTRKYNLLKLDSLPHTWFEIMFDQKSGNDCGKERVNSEMSARKIHDRLKAERRVICPQPLENIWKWARTIPEPKNVRVVVTGQDPYHTVVDNNNSGPITMADGLAFSVNPEYALLGKALPPTLVNIMKLADKLYETRKYDDNRFRGDLTKWTEGGVLLLNATLTTVEGVANAHADIGWHAITDRVIEWLGRKEPNESDARIFMLWGNEAKKKVHLIDSCTHSIMVSCHPSPLSAHKHGWFNRDLFKETNLTLRILGHSPVNWSCRRRQPQNATARLARTNKIESRLTTQDNQVTHMRSVEENQLKEVVAVSEDKLQK